MFVGNIGPGLGQSLNGDGVERGNGISIVLIIGDPTAIKKYINKREKNLLRFDEIHSVLWSVTFHYLKLLSFLYNYRSMHI